ncbi:MAG: alpha-galactosidase [Armatimonadota bacterium]|nr:alpha-galactosidase [bacterium]MDW8320991.1 alpha-galactosidase [Armatimonadota bacterium]
MFVTTITSAEEMQRWMHAQFARGIVPPFSFDYGGKPSAELVPRWGYEQRSRRIDRSLTSHTFLYTDPATGLQVECECTLFRDFPAIEWVLRFRNAGAQDTPILANIQAIDAALVGGQRWKLHYAQGSNARRDDFAPIVHDLKPGKPVHLTPAGGRSSNTVALPFFNFQTDGGGVVFAIGWSGQWSAHFEAGYSNRLHLRAGMERTHLKLYPGETVRTLRILLLAWQGDDEFAGFNRLRRFLLRYRVPRRRGKPVVLPFTCSSCGPPDEANTATEQSQMEFASHFVQYGVEYLWLDAGWFEGRWPNGVGNWFPRKDGFPRGLRPLSEGIRRMGMKGLLLWFEPERVYEGTWLDREHPDWVLRLPNNPHHLLNLGHPSALEWLTEHLSETIEREGIAVYRQDFNIDPLPFWRAADLPDRQGITEIRHIEGLYALWDTLLDRHPGLLIDNCASGGRRLDLETISRSVALWRSDYHYFEPVGQQCHTAGISRYLPTTATGCGYPDAYLARSAMNAGLNLWTAWSPTASYETYRRFLPPEATWQPGQPFPLQRAKAITAEFRRVRRYFFGDFYELTPYSTADDVWMAYQFHLPGEGSGIVVAFRRTACSQATQCLHWRAVDPNSPYEVYLSDERLRRTRRVVRGAELLRGMDVTIEHAPGSLLIEYRKH